jgi:hypothetical protein
MAAGRSGRRPDFRGRDNRQGARFFLMLLIVQASCYPVLPDECGDWNWIHAEACSMDWCHQELDEERGECRAGECWCCTDNECRRAW